MHSDDFRRQKINRLPKHPGFSFDSAHAPADNAETIDHGGVGIGSDEGVRDKRFLTSDLQSLTC